MLAIKNIANIIMYNKYMNETTLLFPLFFLLLSYIYIVYSTCTVFTLIYQKQTRPYSLQKRSSFFIYNVHIYFSLLLHNYYYIMSKNHQFNFFCSFSIYITHTTKLKRKIMFHIKKMLCILK